MKNVLLMGNGIDRAYNKDSLSWTSLLEKMTTVENLPKHEILPFPLEAVLRTDDNVEEALEKLGSDLYGSVVDEKLRSVLTKVLKMKFDDILTTNYDYALEGTAIYPEKILDVLLKKLTKHTGEVKRLESSKFMLHTYLEAVYDGVENRIWHIHGEARKKKTIVIDHEMYLKAVENWHEKLRQRTKEYVLYTTKMQEAPSECWLDSFMLGNVYILGLGLDFSELDLWWLLSQKKRLKTKDALGKIIFYEPEWIENVAKYALLKTYGVEVRHLKYKIPERGQFEDCDEDLQAEHDLQEEERQKFINEAYEFFYLDALEDIEKEMKRA